ncbi:hypothetical protein ACSX1A_18615 [Pontibacter sp. MBLB2868]|uniref:hypothetical protein n=1 Tax=Pontibacter sp. MBLB2868 TaxID=3451555 RepID=UPI003F756646
MESFLYINLTHTNAYQQPVPERIKAAFPGIAILDLDARSGELVQHYALRLLRDSEKGVVCIKVDDSTTDIAVLMPLLEELFEEHAQRLVLLQGQHARLQRMFGARPDIEYAVVEEDEVLRAVERFLQND